MLFVDLEQGSDEWKEWRKTKVMASETSIVMGNNPWKTPLTLWKQKKNLLPDDEENHAMREGKRLEPIAREKFIKESGITFIPCVGIHDKYQWMGASFDGISLCGKYILEIKCGGLELYKKAEIGEVPIYYNDQIQKQLLVSGSEKCYYFVYYQGMGICVEVYPDEDYIQRLTVEEIKFYECMQSSEQPPLTDNDYIKRDDEEWEVAVEKWKISKENLKSCEMIEEQARQNLIQLSGQLNSEGAGIKLSRCLRKGNVNYKQIIEDYEITNEEKYRKPDSEYFRITEV